MNTSESKVVKVFSWAILIILALLPFHALLTVWLSGLVGHYILLRLWKEILLVALCSGAAFILARDRKLRLLFYSSVLIKLAGLYFLINVLWGAVAYSLHKVTLKALGYGLVINLRFLIFFAAVYIFAAKSPLLKMMWAKIILIPAAAVMVFGLLQRLVLPYDFLKHFGYSVNTIYPYETINHNIHYPRVMSSLRGANPLGAYLILILTIITSFFIRAKKQRWLWASFGVIGTLVLVFTYSRSAWIGMLISLLALVWVGLKSEQLKKVLLAASFVILMIVLVAVWSLRHDAAFENIIFHTQTNSAIKTTSDQGHAAGFKNGVHDVLHEPLGEGPGTAGPASVYNNKARIAENYYLQIGQELGWAGLLVFLAINALIVLELWKRRDQQLAQILLASLIGITFVNLLSHAWTDDTLCYLWWGLAGICMAPSFVKHKRNRV
jgi:hypothetical protein